jgi:hypothetical protein
MYSRTSIIAMAFGAMFAASQAQASNLIVNGDFGTGNFGSSWTADAVTYPMNVVITPVAPGNTSGYAAQIAGYSYGLGPDTLSQTVADTANQVYDLSFYLEVQDGNPVTSLVVNWGATQVFSELNTGPFDIYQLFSFDVTGTGSDKLEFITANDPSLTFLDDVSLTPVTATPLPSTWTMLIAGFVGLGFFAYRGSKKNSATIAA